MFGKMSGHKVMRFLPKVKLVTLLRLFKAKLTVLGAARVASVNNCTGIEPCAERDGIYSVEPVAVNRVFRNGFHKATSPYGSLFPIAILPYDPKPLLLQFGLLMQPAVSTAV